MPLRAQELKDTLPPGNDSSSIQANIPIVGEDNIPGWVKTNIRDTVVRIFYKKHSFYPISTLNLGTKISYQINEERGLNNKDSQFYALVLIVAILAFIKLVFPKYYKSIFNLLLQPGFRQKQTREQLLQNQLPSLLMNLFFVLITAMMATLVIDYFDWLTYTFTTIYFYALAGIGGVYLIKYLFLKLLGWAFGAKEIAAQYIFLVFLINKILAVVFIPFVLLISFSQTSWIPTLYTICLFLIVLAILYRSILAINLVRRKAKINPVHFFLYICGIEIAPMLVLCKLLINYLSSSNY